MKIEIRPIERERWHRVHSSVYSTKTVSIQALVDPITKKYKTGLSKEDLDTLIKTRSIEGITEHNVDSYTGKPHPIWDTPEFRIKLEPNTMVFDDSNFHDRIKISIIKDSKFVANSESQIDEFPDATHVIVSEEEEAKVKSKKIELIHTAYGLLSKLSAEEKSNIITVLTGKLVESKSLDVILVEIDTIIQEKPAEFIDACKESKNGLATKALIKKGLYKNILTKKGANIFYMDERVGSSLTEAAEFFDLPENSSLKISLKGKLE